MQITYKDIYIDMETCSKLTMIMHRIWYRHEADNDNNRIKGV